MKASLFLALAQWCASSLVIVAGAEEHKNIDSWQNCEIFFAPSSLPGGGWGAFAGRDFEANEVVEISPRYIAMPHESPIIVNSVIDDYIYGYIRWDDAKRELYKLAGVICGKVMFYNHHRDYNIMWTSFGREPLEREPTISQSNGFVARRKIEAGEELFSTYGEEDGGERWFKDRRLELMTVPTYASRKNGTVYEEDKKKYCSKIHAGFGKPSWEGRVLASIFGQPFPYTMKLERLAPEDHPEAVVNQDVSAGAVLEMVPALVVNSHMIGDTPLAPMSFFWSDWDETQQQDLKDLRTSKDLRVQLQDYTTDWERMDRFRRFEEVVVFPAAGNIALVKRVGKTDEANCMIKILSSGSMKSHESHGGGNGSAGILLQIIATKDLKTGERLKLNIQSTATPHEKQLLLEELLRSGQPVPEHLKDQAEPRTTGDEL
jgi:hypothetical protein